MISTPELAIGNLQFCVLAVSFYECIGEITYKSRALQSSSTALEKWMELTEKRVAEILSIANEGVA